MFFSTLFQIVYLHAKTNKIAPSADLGLRAITMMIVQYVNTGMTSWLTGGCLNPTIGLTATVFREIIRKHGDISYIRYLPAYFFGPLISGLISAVFVRYVAIVVTPEPYFDDKTTVYSK